MNVEGKDYTDMSTSQANANSYPLDGEQVGTEADDWLHRATPSNIVCNRVIDTLKSEVRQESDIQIRGALNYAIALIRTMQYELCRETDWKK